MKGVHKLLKNHRSQKTTNPDTIPSYILKDAADQLAHTLTARCTKYQTMKKSTKKLIQLSYSERRKIFRCKLQTYVTKFYHSQGLPTQCIMDLLNKTNTLTYQNRKKYVKSISSSCTLPRRSRRYHPPHITKGTYGVNHKNTQMELLLP